MFDASVMWRLQRAAFRSAAAAAAAAVAAAAPRARLKCSKEVHKPDTSMHVLHVMVCVLTRVQLGGHAVPASCARLAAAAQRPRRFRPSRWRWISGLLQQRIKFEQLRKAQRLQFYIHP